MFTAKQEYSYLSTEASKPVECHSVSYRSMLLVFWLPTQTVEISSLSISFTHPKLSRKGI